MDSPDTPAPMCTKCGHEPCPFCVEWCDVILSAVWCPACDEPIGRFDDNGDISGHLPYPEATQRFAADHQGAQVTCHHNRCGHKFVFDIKTHAEAGELCCDGDCTWDQPQEVVAAWCEEKKR